MERNEHYGTALAILFFVLIGHAKSILNDTNTVQNNFENVYFQYGTEGKDYVSGLYVGNDVRFTVTVPGNETNNKVSTTLMYKIWSTPTFVELGSFGITPNDTANDFIYYKTNWSNEYMVLCGLTYGELDSITQKEHLKGVKMYQNSSGYVANINTAQGYLIWVWQLDYNSNSEFAAITQNSDSFLFAVGTTRNNLTNVPYPQYVQGGADIVVAFLDPESGRRIWVKTYGTEYEDQAFGVAAPNGKSVVWVVGNTVDPEHKGDVDFLIMSIDISNGRQLSWTSFGGRGKDRFTDIFFDEVAHMFFMSGATTGNYTKDGIALDDVYFNEHASVLAAFESNMTLQWMDVRRGDGGVSLGISVVSYTNEDNRTLIALVGHTEATEFLSTPNAGVGSDIFLVIYDKDGIIVDHQLIGSPGDDRVDSIGYGSNFTQLWIGGCTNSTFINASNVGDYDALIVSTNLSSAILYGPSSDTNSTSSYNSSSSSLEQTHKHPKEWRVLVISLSVLFGTLLVMSLAVGIAYKLRDKNRNRGNAYQELSSIMDNNHGEPGTYEDVDVILARDNRGQTGNSARESRNIGNDWIINYKDLKLKNAVGKGSFGEVYRADWRGIPVAVKKMIAPDNEDMTFRVQDFFAEAELMKNLRPHSNITQLMGVCASPFCIITEFVSNGSLYNWLHSNKEMNSTLQLQIARGIACGMIHLHSEGVIHRDLAARNILLNEALVPKVSDFGLSRVVLDNKTQKTVATVGPVRWMAPEALREKVYNTKTDVWSFGVIIYEILTRKNPYEDFEPIQVATNVALGLVSLMAEILQLQQQGANFPPKLVITMNRCLQQESKSRPEFSEILHYLDAEDDLDEAGASEGPSMNASSKNSSQEKTSSSQSSSDSQWIDDNYPAIMLDNLS